MENGAAINPEHTVPDIDPTVRHNGKSYSKEDMLNAALEFLSNASNESLIACFVGLGAITYFILGRVGLVLIGIAGGVVLHATWEGKDEDAVDDLLRVAKNKRKNETGLDAVQRILQWREQKTATMERDEGPSDVDVLLSARKPLDFGSFQPAIGIALTGFVDAVIRDYVKWWYSPILPEEESFPFACRQTLTGFLLSFSAHLSRKRPEDVFLNFLTNATSIFVVFLDELSNALMAATASGLEPEEAIEEYLKNSPGCNLSTITDEGQQRKKLLAVAEDILETFVDPKAYSCDAVRAFLREILAGLILEMTVRSCSKPEWINGWIVYLLEEGEPEIMNAIDAGVNGATGKEINNAVAQQELNEAAAENAVAPGSPLNGMRAQSEHRRRVSKAEEAMKEAMLEAKRLSEMIAAEDAKKNRHVEDAASSDQDTAGFPTPSSSLSDLLIQENASDSDPREDPDSMVQPLPQATSNGARSFTSFDQILPPNSVDDLEEDSRPKRTETPPLTLHDANVTIFDDAMPGEKASVRSRPTIDYLLQIEPASSHHRGWMIARKYADFETLHEVLKRISVVSGVAAFSTKYVHVPPWKGQTKESLRADLEKYLRDALSFNRLAECEGMKRFLEKDQAPGQKGQAKGVLGFPSPAAFETMGKGMLDVLTAAPKGVAGGGKAVFDGVGGIFQKKPANPNRQSTASKSALVSPVSSLPPEPRDSITSITGRSRRSTDLLHDHPPALTSFDGSATPSLSETRSSTTPSSSRASIVTKPTSLDLSGEDNPWSEAPKTEHTAPGLSQESLHLPPPPSEIEDDYHAAPISQKSTTTSAAPSLHSRSRTNTLSQHPPHLPKPDTASQSPTSPLATATNPPPPKPASDHPTSTLPPSSPSRPTTTLASPLTLPETRLTIDLLFTLITTLFRLTSTWSIRLTLLAAAKSYLLRPANVSSIESIRSLIQDTLISPNTSDAGIAAHLQKLRENALPTEEELKAWPPEMREEEKEALRSRARRALVERGMPAALKGVMGAQASGEALGRVFDALQVGKVGRGVVFAVVLQAVRAVMH